MKKLSVLLAAAAVISTAVVTARAASTPEPAAAEIAATPTPTPRPCEPARQPGELIKQAPFPQRKPTDIVTAPEVIQRVQPDYPAVLHKALVTGKVILEAIVASDGLVHELRVVQSPHPDLSRLACDAMYQWRFKPGTFNGQALPIYSVFTFDFAIKEKEEPAPQATPPDAEVWTALMASIAIDEGATPEQPLPVWRRTFFPTPLVDQLIRDAASGNWSLCGLGPADFATGLRGLAKTNETSAVLPDSVSSSVVRLYDDPPRDGDSVGFSRPFYLKGSSAALVGADISATAGVVLLIENRGGTWVVAGECIEWTAYR